MPNELGLFTKQEAKKMRDIYALNDHTLIFMIADGIVATQNGNSRQTAVEINMVVHDDVEKYFKNTVGYDVISDRTGQSAGYTLLKVISWNL